jgi:hypothetical protein
MMARDTGDRLPVVTVTCDRVNVALTAHRPAAEQQRTAAKTANSVCSM